jgi:hypothetical protein
VDDKVIVIPGGANGKAVVAYNARTGAHVWGALEDRASYTSPMLVTLAGRRQVLAVTMRNVAGLSPEDGTGPGSFTPTAEIDEVRWVTREAAGDLLSYDHDADVVDSLSV